tara:strand:- start:960 stop:1478 length:519 start_codon:yes stop_codon:yes gene_type:complete
MSETNHTLTDEQFATVCCNILHTALIETPRTTSKRVFRELEAGTRVSLTQLKMEDESTLRMDLRLITDDFKGTLNYSTFRDALQVLLSRFREHITQEQPLKAFRALDESGEATLERRLYAITAPIVSGAEINVMMLGVDPHPSEPVVLLELMFVDPEQFAQSESESSASSSS